MHPSNYQRNGSFPRDASDWCLAITVFCILLAATAGWDFVYCYLLWASDIPVGTKIGLSVFLSIFAAPLNGLSVYSAGTFLNEVRKYISSHVTAEWRIFKWERALQQEEEKHASLIEEAPEDIRNHFLRI